MTKREIYKLVGRNLTTRRRELKYTQSEVAKAVGISRPSLANIEGGRQALSLHQLYKLAAALDLRDATSLLPTGNIERISEASVGENDIKIASPRLNKDQLSEIKRIIASTTSAKR